MSDKLFGKYRGTVTNNIDPLQTGRLQVQVPDALGMVPSSWAMPCMPVAGAQMGIYAIPPIGAGVWVEFEQGDPDHPIWVGCYWGSAAEVPPLALAAPPALPNLVIQTQGQHTLLLSDVPGGQGITLKTAAGAMLMISDTGIILTNGQGATITLTGPTVTINQGALVVT